MTRKSRPAPEEGQIFVPHAGHRPRAPFRRIVGVIGRAVIYSTGGDRNGICTIRTLLRWGGKA